jgi:malonyl-CoA decarboxylase
MYTLKINPYFFQEKGEALLLMTEERLRHTLIPQYQQLFSKIGRINGGVKFLVDMRADILVSIYEKL